MFEFSFWETIIDYLMFASCLFIVFGSIYISLKLRFVQCRLLPDLFRMMASMMKKQGQKEGAHTILPYKALITAMSTTLGIGTIVGPIVAIYWGGPGALVGFLLTAFFGSAATFTEVNLCIKHRKRLPNGQILGGPMQYMKAILSSAAAKWYAVFGCILMISWSGAQANQLGAILDSPLLGEYRIPTMISGLVTAILVLAILIGGIKRISSVSSKLVPAMFTLYLGSSLWILALNIDKLGDVMTQIMHGVLTPYTMASGSIVGGIVSALRWGVFKGSQATEAGLGTQTIPHSMAETDDSKAQGMLAMVSTYTAGLVAFLTGCVVLVTDTWQDESLPLGISMIAASFNMYFSYFGIAIVTICTLLFAYGTILGNSYNGSQCFAYLTRNKKATSYYLITGFVIFISTIASIKEVWSVIDIGLACLIVPHMTALIMYTYKNADTMLDEGEIANLDLDSPSFHERPSPVK